MRTIHLLLLNIIFLALLGCSATKGLYKTNTLTLLSGMETMEYRYMLFKTPKGDTLCAKPIDTCLTPTGYKYIWTSDGPPVYIQPQYMNKIYKVTYSPLTDKTIYVQGQPPYNMDIQKLELVK